MLQKGCIPEEIATLKAHERWLASLYLTHVPTKRSTRLETLLTYLRAFVLFLKQVCFPSPSSIAEKVESYFSIFQSGKRLLVSVTTSTLLCTTLWRVARLLAQALCTKAVAFVTPLLWVVLATLCLFCSRRLLCMPPSQLSRTTNVNHTCTPQLDRPRLASTQQIGAICDAFTRHRCVVLRDRAGEGKTYRTNLLAQLIRYYPHLLPTAMHDTVLYRIDTKYVTNTPQTLAQTLTLLKKELGPAQKRAIIVCDEGHNLFNDRQLYNCLTSFLQQTDCRLLLTTTLEDSATFYATNVTQPPAIHHQQGAHQWCWLQAAPPRAASVLFVNQQDGMPVDPVLQTLAEATERGEKSMREACIAADQLHTTRLQQAHYATLCQAAAQKALTKATLTPFLPLLCAYARPTP